MPVYKGIDLSHWQGIGHNVKLIKESGNSFAMIKAGGADGKNGGMYTDPMFEENYKAFTKGGMHVGAYYFTGYNFKGAYEGKREAMHFLEIIKGKKFDYPVAVDIEAVSGDKHAITVAAISFCETMEQNGYYVVIYASDVSGFAERLNIDRLKKFDKWVAKYSKNKPAYVKDYGMWQFGGSVNYICSPVVPGIARNPCDQNFSYKDYPSVIKKAGLNGFSKKPIATKIYSINIKKASEGDCKTITDLCDNLGLEYETREI